MFGNNMVEPHYDQIWKNHPMPLNYTCCCGLDVHPFKRVADAIHIYDCPYNNDKIVGEYNGKP